MAKNNNNLIFISIGAALLLFFVFSDTAYASSASSGMISDSQLQQTANFESFSSTAYPDGSTNGVQNYSIGYGHQIQPNESNLLTQTISQAQGQQLLLNDMQSVVSAIIDSGASFTQGQFDALSDFGYNEGIGAMNKIIATYQSSGSDAAASQMLQYIYWHPVVGGPAVVSQNLVNRRNANVNSWNS